MSRIKFYKYSCNGNNFILIDELERGLIVEPEKEKFSKYIGDLNTGLGCDSVIFLQNYNKDILSEIYHNPMDLNYKLKDYPQYIMRVYENGTESNMCGNGLLCLGYHLLLRHKINNALVATEIPTYFPVVRSVSTLLCDKYASAKIGIPSLPSDSFVSDNAIINANNPYFYHLKDMPLGLNLNDDDYTLSNAYITFTGEPHIVIFKQVSPIGKYFNELFQPNNKADDKFLQNSLIDVIGEKLNANLNYFPKGVNVNFADIISDSSIVYRCYERGVNCETYACGTGAVAVACLAQELGMLKSETLSILPWRARQCDLYKNSEILIHRENNNYTISAKPLFLSEGTYCYPGVATSENLSFAA